MENSKKQRSIIGVVTKLSSEKTIKVEIESKYPHPKYGKIIKKHKRYLVHVEDKFSNVKVGDVVLIGEIRPVSKNKYWEVLKVLKENK